MAGEDGARHSRESRRQPWVDPIVRPEMAHGSFSDLSADERLAESRKISQASQPFGKNGSLVVPVTGGASLSSDACNQSITSRPGDEETARTSWMEHGNLMASASQTRIARIADEDHYHLELLSSPADILMHNADLVAVHEYNETVESAWIYSPRQEPYASRQEASAPKQETSTKWIKHAKAAGIINNLKVPSKRRNSKDDQYGNGGPRVTVTAPSESARRDSIALRMFNREDHKFSSLQRSRIPEASEPQRTDDTAESIRSRTRSPSGRSPSARPSMSSDRRTCWLLDDHMLPKQMPNARIFRYLYQTRANISITECLDEAARQMVSRLKEYRTYVDHKNVPIVFVGSGFGCLILQKAMVLLSNGEDPDNSLCSDAVAGIFLLDAPLQYLRSHSSQGQSQSQNSSPSPLSSNIRWIKEYFTLSNSPEQLSRADKLWEEFKNLFKHNKPNPFIFWYKGGDSKVQPFNELGIEIIGVSVPDDKKAARKGRFGNPNSEYYLKLIEQLRHCLFMRVCAIKEHEDQLPEYIKQDCHNIEPMDMKRWSPLHVAAAAANHAAVTRLINQGKAEANRQDAEGKTPLHVAIERAALLHLEDPSYYESKSHLTKVIKELKERTNVLLKDNKGKTPWDYVSGREVEHKWILDIKKRLYFHPVVSSPKLEVKKVEEPNEAQLEVCRTAEAYLSEFFKKTDSYGKVEYSRKESTASIQQLIYDREDDLHQILARLRDIDDRETESHCRWIHFPANNEQWIHDFFIKMNIIDTSMVHQRHQGGKLIDRCMIAQARRYQQTILPGNDAKQESKRPSVEGEYASELYQNSDPASSITSTTSISSREVESADTIATFMPIMAYEKHAQRKLLSSTLEGLRKSKRRSYSLFDLGLGETPKALRAYFMSERPLHCRRTLDQFSYYMLRSTEDRDSDQVALRWAPRDKKENAPILMVDQLWLWAMHDGTILTCFPNTWNSNEEFNLSHVLTTELMNRSQNTILSAEELIHFILKNTVDFFNRKGPLGFKFQEGFNSSINRVAEGQAKQFKKFNDNVHRLETKTGGKPKSADIEELFRLHKETKLLVTIMDIQDELTIVKTVLMQQQEVLRSLSQLYQRKGSMKNVSKGDKKGNASNSNKHVHFRPQGGQPDTPNKSHIVLQDRDLMAETEEIVNKNIEIVKHMMANARTVQDSLNHLLDLKQMHVNAWEARISRHAQQETQKQGNVICVFTVVTIIFLPLSFIVAFFDLPVESFPQDEAGEISWPLDKVSLYLVGLSAAFSIPLICVALATNRIRVTFESWMAWLDAQKPRLKDGLNPKVSDYEDSDDEDFGVFDADDDDFGDDGFGIEDKNEPYVGYNEGGSSDDISSRAYFARAMHSALPSRLQTRHRRRLNPSDYPENDMDWDNHASQERRTSIFNPVNWSPRSPSPASNLAPDSLQARFLQPFQLAVKRRRTGSPGPDVEAGR